MRPLFPINADDGQKPLIVNVAKVRPIVCVLVSKSTHILQGEYMVTGMQGLGVFADNHGARSERIE